MPGMRTHFDTTSEDVNAYQLLTAVVVPRPIAWVSTLSEAGVVNLAPHSFYTVVCANPPLVMFSSVGAKDTLRNVQATEEFVISLAHAPMIEAVNNSAARFPAEESESGRLDIEMSPSVGVAPPRVAGSPVSLECRLHSTTELGDSTMVIGHVRLITVDDDALVDGRPDFTRLDPLARLGGNQWSLHAEVVAIDRPQQPSDIEGLDDVSTG